MIGYHRQTDFPEHGSLARLGGRNNQHPAAKPNRREETKHPTRCCACPRQIDRTVGIDCRELVKSGAADRLSRGVPVDFHDLGGLGRPASQGYPREYGVSDANTA